MSGFTFGSQPASSGDGNKPLFGSTSAAGGGLFGSGTTANSSNNLFKGAGQTTNPPSGEQPSIFGSANANKSTNPFGQPSSAASTGGFNLGPKDDNASSPSLFGGLGTPKPTQTTFGSTTPNPPSSAGNWTFGAPSTTPAGPPPSQSTFGASTGGGGGIFGNVNKPAGDKPSTGTSSIFGSMNNNGGTNNLFGKPSQTTSSSSTPGPTASTGGLFGQPPSSTGAASQSGTPATSNLFGQPSSNTQQQPPSSSAPSFGFGKPAESSTPAAPASSSNLFGQKPAPPTGNSLFGAQPATSQPQTTQPSTQQSSSSLFLQQPSGSSNAPKPAFSFPAPTPSSQPTTTPATAAEAPKLGLFLNPASSTPATTAQPAKSGLFSGLGAPTPAAPSSSNLFGSAPTSSQPAPPATTTTSTPGNLFGPSLGATSSQPSSTAPTTATATSSTPAFSFPSSAAAPTASTTAAAAASTQGPAPPSQSRLKNKTMDEILTRWATDLTKYTKEFKSHADTIAKWDQLIVDNSTKIDKLYVKTRNCERQTMSVEMQLNAVESQQDELEAWLSRYEKEVDDMLAKDASGAAAGGVETGGPDHERERTYKLAERLAERLDEMSRDLEGMVEEVNAANAGLSRGKADEPITQIVKILNSHLSQLQAIDQGAAELQQKVEEAKRGARGLMYLGNGSGTNGNGAAVDGFTRSWLGK